jgi:hypothetical protein
MVLTSNSVNSIPQVTATVAIATARSASIESCGSMIVSINCTLIAATFWRLSHWS